MTAHVMFRIHYEDIPETGLQVRYRLGENFEGEVDWDEPQLGVLLPSASVNDLNEYGLVVDDNEVPGFAGFESRSGTYWRYQHESDPEVFREYCLQVIEILEPFTPRSSWHAWHLVSQLGGSNRLRLSLKNGVTHTELSYKIVDKGFGYQIKDLSAGRRVQKMLKHDFILNQLLGTSFKKLDYHNMKIEVEQGGEEAPGGLVILHFLKEQLVLRYQLSLEDFALGLFDARNHDLELIKLVEVPHSSVIEDTRSFLG